MSRTLMFIGFFLFHACTSAATALEGAYHDASRCDLTPGLADAYVLALSWQPGFCETYGYEADKPECLRLSADDFAASHGVLHGLWPNQKACGTHYGFCGVKSQAHHCDYAQLFLSDTVKNDLTRLMPSYHHGSCLERHEWNKHGSCQLLTVDAYFTLAMRLTNEFNQTLLGQHLHEHTGETVTLTQINEWIAQSFEPSAKQKIHLICKQGVLVDVFIQLPAHLSEVQSLAELISKAESAYKRHACPERLTVSAFTAQ